MEPQDMLLVVFLGSLGGTFLGIIGAYLVTAKLSELGEDENDGD